MAGSKDVSSRANRGRTALQLPPRRRCRRRRRRHRHHRPLVSCVSSPSHPLAPPVRSTTPSWASQRAPQMMRCSKRVGAYGGWCTGGKLLLEQGRCRPAVQHPTAQPLHCTLPLCPSLRSLPQAGDAVAPGAGVECCWVLRRRRSRTASTTAFDVDTRRAETRAGVLNPCPFPRLCLLSREDKNSENAVMASSAAVSLN